MPGIKPLEPYPSQETYSPASENVGPSGEEFYSNKSPPLSPRSAEEIWDEAVQKVHQRIVRNSRKSSTIIGSPPPPKSKRASTATELEIISSYGRRTYYEQRDPLSPIIDPPPPSPVVSGSASTTTMFRFVELDFGFLDRPYTPSSNEDAIPSPLSPNQQNLASTDLTRLLSEEQSNYRYPLMDPSTPSPAGLRIRPKEETKSPSPKDSSPLIFIPAGQVRSPATIPRKPLPTGAANAGIQFHHSPYQHTLGAATPPQSSSGANGETLVNSPFSIPNLLVKAHSRSHRERQSVSFIKGHSRSKTGSRADSVLVPLSPTRQASHTLQVQSGWYADADDEDEGNRDDEKARLIDYLAFKWVGRRGSRSSSNVHENGNGNSGFWVRASENGTLLGGDRGECQNLWGAQLEQERRQERNRGKDGHGVNKGRRSSLRSSLSGLMGYVALPHCAILSLPVSRDGKMYSVYQKIVFGDTTRCYSACFSNFHRMFRS
ncbi:hypothetical protein M501DRAFT_1031238 [Patellaria atrata CBS 101060]|uniref:Uncharacterized protein n=1 Tax=Patellaria atrata CBS 101060 TaxID=1346257 RepID=A0A9P4SAI2_9PEZI|nr:hypothetical protein M501DRAFT_1031238 [Patellaria atrata CBS 101060]